MEPSPLLEQPGATIGGRYLLEHLLGRGGMAAVYRARDQRSGQQVAIKRCWARDPLTLQRRAALLEREFHTLAHLAHPRIIEVYDYGMDEGGPYYTMELLEGAALEQAERLPWREVSAVLCDVASSLALLHSRSLVHRDVSLRNVHYAKDGRVKLLDFGAMASMGVVQDIVGTPPFMAPEVVQLQALDARADLFSLGALGYRLLTGRHAYPARAIGELRDAWRSKPMPPATLVPDIPAELNGLILRLLTLDRGGRPNDVAEVIERLRTLAGLVPDDTAEVTRAYLTTPVLVGRESAQLEVRRRMLSLVRGDGGLLLVRGNSGSGRSRVLDACALEGKLLGANVLRADARDASQGEWGVARALGNRLLEQFPQAAFEEARLTRNVLGELFESLRRDEKYPQTVVDIDRSILIRDLRDWIFSIAKRHRMLIIVDDVERIDDESTALLSALAHRAERHPILLALATDSSSSRSLAGPLRLLDDLAQAIELEDLEPPETEALIRSVFGDVPNVALCAARIHGLSHGNPRAALELAQHLVDTRRARYEAGTWALPTALDEHDLPSTLAASLSARLVELSADARELASVLALADGTALKLAVYPALTQHGDVKRVFHALDELVAARILIAGADCFVFAQRGFVGILDAALAPKLRAGIHQRIARELARSGSDVLLRAHHLFEAQLEDEAVELLLSAELQKLYPSVELLKRALAAAERLKLSAAASHRLRMTLLIHAPLSLDTGLRDVYAIVLRQLEQDAGLVCFRELAELPADQRLAKALALTQQAYERTPEHERVHSVIEAVRELARMCGAVAAMSVTTFDLDLLESLPSLDPLFPLSPTLTVVAQIVEASKAWISGRLLVSRAIHMKIRARISEPDRAGFDEHQHERARLMIEYGLGLSDAAFGIESAEQHAKVLEENRTMRVNAWRIRALFQLARGNAIEARRCARRSELLEVQDGLRERYGGSTIGIDLGLYSRLGDLLGVKGLLERLAVMASRHRGWEPVEQYGRARYCELQGDLAGALRHVEAGLAMLPPLRYPFFIGLAATHVRVLYELQRNEEAATHARAYLRLAEENALSMPELPVAAGLALARVGDDAAAVAILDRAIAQAEALNRIGLGLGTLYEGRARLAIGMRDRAAFERFAQRCTEEYAKADNPALGTLLAALYEQAQTGGLHLSIPAQAVARALSVRPPEHEFESVHSRMAECLDASDRARCALTLLMQSTFSGTGYLYAVGVDGRLRLVGALPDTPNDLELQRWVEQHASAWSSPSHDEVATATETLSTASETGASAAPDPVYCDAEGRRLELALLITEAERGRSLSGVLVLQMTPPRRVFPPPALCKTIARELLEYGDAAARVRRAG